MNKMDELQINDKINDKINREINNSFYNEWDRKIIIATNLKIYFGVYKMTYTDINPLIRDLTNSQIRNKIKEYLDE